jgi:hypothetical protein
MVFQTLNIIDSITAKTSLSVLPKSGDYIVNIWNKAEQVPHGFVGKALFNHMIKQCH